MSLTDQYFIINKPYGMVSQFVSSHDVRLLGELDFSFPPGIHPIGRLDHNSEGLLILTTDKKVTRLLFQGETPHRRTYLVKVRYTVSPESLGQLKSGVPISMRGGAADYITAPCEAEIIERPENLSGSEFETKEYVPHTWLRITLTEGKFRQVRKMTTAIGHRCVRLIRWSIEGLELAGLPAGGVREIERVDFFNRLKIPEEEIARIKAFDPLASLQPSASLDPTAVPEP